MNQTFGQRVQEVLKEESATPKHWMYLSFADDERGFLGGVIVQGHGIVDARLSFVQLGITSPGGEVLAFDLPDDSIPPEKYRNRLLTAEEICEFWPDAKTIREHEEEQSRTAN